jgi:hypothetical protein
MPPFLKNIAHDLVEKRLWPVAVALVAAVVAVPFLLGGSDVPATPPASAAAAAAKSAAAGQSPVSLDTTLPSGEYDRAGKVRNPFRQPKVKTPGTPSANPAGGTAPDKTTTTGGTGTGGTGTGTPGTTPATPAPTKPDTVDTYRLTLRFGTAGHLRTISDLARLSPLPSTDNPFFVYLGVLKDGQTAVFLISSDVSATGDGKCRPSASDCQTIEVKEGDTEFFDMKDGDTPVQYEMDVLHLDKTTAADQQVTAAQARAAAARHSKAGAAMLRAAHADEKTGFEGMNGYRWMPATGLLVRVPAKASGASAGGAATAAKALPGLPVWHAELAR